MNVYTCTDHAYFWPVGVASIVVANSEEHAVELLKGALKETGLDANKPFTLQKISLEIPHAQVLLTGEY